MSHFRLFILALCLVLVACANSPTPVVSTPTLGPNPDMDAMALAVLSEQALQVAQAELPDAVLRQVDSDLTKAVFHFTDSAATEVTQITVPTLTAPPEAWVVQLHLISPLVGQAEPSMDLQRLKVGPQRVAQALTAHWPGCEVRGMMLYPAEGQLTWTAFCNTAEGVVSGSMSAETGVFEASLAPPVMAPPTATPQPLLTQPFTPTPTPANTLILSIREPDLQQLNDYLKGLFPDNFYFAEEDYVTHATPFEEQTFLAEDISGDGELDQVAYDEITAPPAVGLALVYEDVNGDAENDLIFYGYPGLVVLLWQGTQYAEPFVVKGEWSRGGGPWNAASFQDWTGDGIPEVVLDKETGGGGSDLWIYYTKRSIIHCVEFCKVVWENPVSIYTNDFSTGGLAEYEVDMRLTTDTPPMLRVVDGGFAIYCCSEQDDLDERQSLRLYSSKLKLYTWKGDDFELIQEETIRLAQVIGVQSVLSATNATGTQAAITWQNNGSASNTNEFCQLLINNVPVGKYFGCRHKFTQVAWQDITNDQQAELVITTYSAAYPYGPSLPFAAYGDEVLSAETCPHQKLLAYTWDGQTAVEIANVAGCVIQEDLYGVRLEDYDGDGQTEVLAARIALQEAPYRIENRAYKWNGQRFVMWSEIPAK